MYLLIESGAEYDTANENREFLDEIDFSVCFDAINIRNRATYDARVHMWFVLLGYGAYNDKEYPIDIFMDRNTGEKFDIRKLKNHRNYMFCLTNVHSHGEKWALHIIDKESLWEVARL